jgi:ribosomal RNA-processing protein 8
MRRKGLILSSASNGGRLCTSKAKRRKESKRKCGKGISESRNASVQIEKRGTAVPIGGVSSNVSIPTQSGRVQSHPKQCRPLSNGLLGQVQARMDAARFRWINEKLYTSTSSIAAKMFKDDPGLFDIYHRGFSAQADKWPFNPLDSVIEYIRTLPQRFIIADLGCGEGRLALSVPHTVHSFDLVSVCSHVTSCDMAHLPLSSESVNVVVFCLSLMGTNLKDYLLEAWRILSPRGTLKIVEVVSRVDDISTFVKGIELLGFKLVDKVLLGKMFIDLELRKNQQRINHTSSLTIKLKPCAYKRR